MSREHAPERQGRVRARGKKQLLYSRADTAHVLGTSVATVIRLEEEGVLKVIRLSRSPTAKAYHTADNVERVARGDLDDE